MDKHKALIREDMTGRRYGRLLVTKPLLGQPNTVWLCTCDCGNECIASAAALRETRTKSCGCLGREKRLKAHLTHGMTHSPEFRAWANMRARCGNPKRADFIHYGGRGITVCDRWSSFENFYADMGERPSKDHSIDRINNNEGYSPENCHWATKRDQAINRRNVKLVTIGEVSLTTTDWLDRLKIDKTKYYRAKKRFGLDAISTIKLLSEASNV